MKHKTYIKNRRIVYTPTIIDKCNHLDGRDVLIEITEYRTRKQRSIQQNGYYWSVVIGAISDYTGQDRETVHVALRYMFLTDRTKYLPEVKSTSDLIASEFETYLANVREFALEEWGLLIPLPNEYI